MTVFSHYIVETLPCTTEIFSSIGGKKKCTVFLTGGYPVMLATTPSPVEVYNDLDSGVLYFFETLRNSGRREVLRRLLENVPSFKNYDHPQLMNGYRDTNLLDRDRITLWYICARAILKSHLQKIRNRKLFHRIGDYEVFQRNSEAAFIYRELQDIDALLSEVHGRLFRMQLEHYSFEKVIQIYDGPDTLFIADLDHVATVDDRKKKDVQNMLKDVSGSTVTFLVGDDGNYQIDTKNKE